ncbi:MAG: hypothetical protein ACTHM1_11420 [Solirubrobacteraceae bacterium]
MSSIHIPAETAAILRSALLTEMGDPAERLSDATLAAGKEAHPEWFSQPLSEIDKLRAALDMLGWSQPQTLARAEIDLDAHRWAIVKALKTQLEVEHGYMESDDEHERRLATGNARVLEEFTRTHGLCEDV